MTNLTNEQEAARVDLISGEPQPGIAAHQLPRELRLLAGVSF